MVVAPREDTAAPVSLHISNSLLLQTSLSPGSRRPQLDLILLIILNIKCNATDPDIAVVIKNRKEKKKSLYHYCQCVPVTAFPLTKALFLAPVKANVSLSAEG